MNIKVSRGNQLFMEWEMKNRKFENINGEVLEFSLKDNILRSFSRTIWDNDKRTTGLSKDIVLINKDEGVSMVFMTWDTSFLPVGISNYEILIVGKNEDEVPTMFLEDCGTVEIVE